MPQGRKQIKVKIAMEITLSYFTNLITEDGKIVLVIIASFA